MVLLGDEAQVESSFSPFRDSVSISARQVHGLCQMYHRLSDRAGVPDPSVSGG